MKKITKIRFDDLYEKFEYEYSSKVVGEKTKDFAISSIHSKLHPNKVSFWRDKPVLTVYANKNKELFQIRSGQGYTFNQLEDIHNIINNIKKQEGYPQHRV